MICIVFEKTLTGFSAMKFHTNLIRLRKTMARIFRVTPTTLILLLLILTISIPDTLLSGHKLVSTAQASQSISSSHAVKISDEDVLTWAEKTLQEATSLDPSSFPSPTQQFPVFFTKLGWNSFKKAKSTGSFDIQNNSPFTSKILQFTPTSAATPNIWVLQLKRDLSKNNSEQKIEQIVKVVVEQVDKDSTSSLAISYLGSRFQEKAAGDEAGTNGCATRGTPRQRILQDLFRINLFVDTPDAHEGLPAPLQQKSLSDLTGGKIKKEWSPFVASDDCRTADVHLLTAKTRFDSVKTQSNLTVTIKVELQKLGASKIAVLSRSLFRADVDHFEYHDSIPVNIAIDLNQDERELSAQIESFIDSAVFHVHIKETAVE